MVANKMPFIAHTFDKLRRGSYKVPEYEKGPGDIFFFQRIQYASHIAVLISRVKSQINNTVGVRVGLVFVNKIAALPLNE